MIDVSAAAVVDGTTVRIGVPSIAAKTGSRSAHSRSACQPNPSRTSKTTARAPATGSGIQATVSPVPRAPMSAGTTPVTAAPA